MEYVLLLLALPAWALCLIASVILFMLGYLLVTVDNDDKGEILIFGSFIIGGFGALVAVVKLFIWMVLE